MSTITKELAKLFRKITNSEIDAEGNAHVVLSPADSLLINNARIALASLEAEPVAWAHRLINKRNGVVHPWVYGSAEACPSEGDIFNIEVMPLYTAPPAPVSVPDEDLLHMAASAIEDLLSNKDRYCAWVWADIPAKLRRAAMLQGANGTLTNEGTITATQFKPVADLYGLTSPTGGETSFTFDAVEARDFIDGGWSCQEYVELERFQEAVSGNSPVIPDGWVLVPIEPTEDMIVNGFESEPDESFSDEKEWEAYDAMSGCQQAAHRAKLCWEAMISAAPKPTVR